MSISYLSQPYKSTVEPFKDNIELIAKVGEMKQNKYDSILSTIFQKENQLLNLDTLNDKITERKNNLLKEADNQLNKLASSDLTVPDNISKVENIFTPIVSDSKLMEDVYYTKQIRENQEFAKETLKKDPSSGNQLNFQTSQSLVDLYRKADENQLGEAAPFAKMFTPFTDVKAKKLKVLSDLKVIKDGYSDSFTTVTENGVKFVKTTDGKVPLAEVLSKFNASLTPEDRQQLVLDGYHQFGNADLPSVMSAVSSQQGVFTTLYNSDLKSLQGKIDVLDKNQDGKVDLEDENQGTNQKILNSYLDQKSFYSQKLESLKQRQEYITKFDKNKDLNLGDRMNLFADIKMDELSNDMVTLLAIPEGLKQTFELDFSKVFDFNADMAKIDLKEKSDRRVAAEKEKKDNPTKSIDYNKDGNPDMIIPDDVNVTNTTIKTDDLLNEYEVENVKNPTFLVNVATNTPNKKDISGAEIKNYRGLFQKIYATKAIKTKEILDKQLQEISIDPETGKVDEEKLTKNKAAYQVYSEAINNSKTDEDKKKYIEQATKTNPLIPTFEGIRQVSDALKSAGTMTDIDNPIKDYIRERWDGKINKINLNPSTIGELKSVYGSQLKQQMLLNLSVYKGIPVKESKEVDIILNAINNIEINKSSTSEEILEAIKKQVGNKLNNSNPINNTYLGMIVGQDIANTLIEQKNDLPKHNLELRENEIQDIYKNLIDKESFLELTVTPPTADQKKSSFYMQLNSSLTKAIVDGEGNYVEINGGKKIPLKEKSSEYKDATFSTIIFNTGTGKVKGIMPGMSGYAEIQLPTNSGENGLPWGIPTNDLIGKKLYLEHYLKAQKKETLTASTPISVGDIPILGKTYIRCNESGQFEVGYYEKNTSKFTPLTESYSNTLQAISSYTDKYMQLTQEAPNLKGSGVAILNQSIK